MSSRPSARYNDPGFFYNQRKLLKIFAIVSGLMMVGILAMIYADWARPWKRDQVAAMEWEARMSELQAMIMESRSQDAAASFEKATATAQAAFDERETQLREVLDRLPTANGAFQDADAQYKAQKQFTGAAIYEWEHSHGEEAVAATARTLAAERDKEARLKEGVTAANDVIVGLRAREKELRRDLDEIVDRIRANKDIDKLGLLRAARDKKRGHSPLRVIPLLDFLAPPTKVEQVVLDARQERGEAGVDPA